MNITVFQKQQAIIFLSLFRSLVFDNSTKKTTKAHVFCPNKGGEVLMPSGKIQVKNFAQNILL